jgi:hypothetical protein
MKTKIFFAAILTLTVLTAPAQCLTRTYANIANNVFSGNLKTSDFAGNLFITVDTVNSASTTVPSEYYEFTDPSDLIKTFNQAMASIEIDSTFFNYYEHFNNSLYNSPLHQSFLVNSANYTYRIDIWNNPNDVTKIEGLTIVKSPDQIERTIY